MSEAENIQDVTVQAPASVDREVVTRRAEQHSQQGDEMKHRERTSPATTECSRRALKVVLKENSASSNGEHAHGPQPFPKDRIVDAFVNLSKDNMRCDNSTLGTHLLSMRPKFKYLSPQCEERADISIKVRSVSPPAHV